MTDQAWEPGIPLYSPNQAPYSLYLFNFRDDFADGEPGPDAADWPAQTRRHLPGDDELAGFIREYHQWKANQ